METHDSYFRATFGAPEQARSLLELTLPKPLADYLGEADLTVVDGSFVDQSLRRRQSDLLIRARRDGRDNFLYYLIEHRSSPARWVGLQLVEYLVRVVRRLADDAARGRGLPPVLAILIVHGRGRSRPKWLDQLIAFPPAISRALRRRTRFPRFVLLDLRRVNDATLLRRVRDAATALALLALKHGPADGLERRILSWAPLLLAVEAAPGGDTALERLCGYLVMINHDSNVPRAMGAIDAGLGARAMRYVNRYLREAHEQGIEQGLARGEVEGTRRTLLRLLERRFGPLPPEASSQVERADRDQLESWENRFLELLAVDDVSLIDVLGPDEFGTPG